MQYITKLKELIYHFHFNDPAEEIHFFKEIKPLFFSEFMYYFDVHRILTHWPAAHEQMQRDYLQAEMDDIRHFYRKNEVFGGLALLNNEVGLARVVKELEEIDAFIAAVNARKAAL